MTKSTTAHDSSNPTYSSWSAMRSRCTNPNHKSFAAYGARGVTVCPRWLSSFETFLADMGERPSRDHTLDRYPDPRGNYEPGNVRWATRAEQLRNRTDNVRLTLDGRTMCAKDWAAELNVPAPTIYSRVVRGYSDAEALSVVDLPPNTRPQDGEQNSSSKLTEAAVREIRASSEPGLVLAKRYGVSGGTIAFVRQRKTWRYVV